ncbi:type IV toxin-antitoxin system AbiEi family antitoxin domain-containing protein [Corynebacterium sp. 153RC1]|nr:MULTISPECIES: type IV toxin-antitoxin system AbiEi family antitoxin domain-containing protein [unclassified Corynebacterium]MCQ9365583.1 type IV toxin-antitoxin system AbiEi family antitoxin domain-containing protein [Corynebacterium sp. 70RC1]MCQ9352622.1 type IV toxin-antitoxin system AbiEi family antitoxin domain-containing protein [Corynebacterium sp. 209RC1]MCQ9354806.1 type IV toxin-antitoxin system AbiEi family antitoxin domain-containing protein [Corynebacterium sp. 1222RC1]MCQ935699
MKSLEVLYFLESLASDQWGIITTAQAKRAGVSRLHMSNMAERGILTRVRRGVYLLPSAQFGPVTDLRAAWVSLEQQKLAVERIDSHNNVAVSHESAAFVHQIGDFIPERHQFSASLRKQTGQKDIKLYCNRILRSEEVVLINGLPVTSVVRTVADLASAKIELNYLATLVIEALRKEGVRMRKLAEALDPSADHYGFHSGLDLIHACQDVAESDEDREERLYRAFSRVDFESMYVPNPPLIHRGLPGMDVHSRQRVTA